MSANKHELLKNYKKNIYLILMLLPGILLLFIFKYIPMYGVCIAFKDFRMMDGIFQSPWVGMKYFKQLFGGNDFLNAFKNTLTISLLKLAFGFPAPIILALLLNEVRIKMFKKIVQTFSYIPYFFSWVVLSGIITMLFANKGPVNELLMLCGAEKPVEFFADGTLFTVMLIVTSIWQSCGWNSILYLAAISGIDESLYEAARMDGAGKWRQTLNITLPALIPTIVTVFILNLGSVMNAGFDQIYNLYNPMVYEVTDIIDTYVLRKMQVMDYSIGTAAGLFKSVISMLLIVGTNKFVSKISDSELGIW